MQQLFIAFLTSAQNAIFVVHKLSYITFMQQEMASIYLYKTH